MEGGVVPFLFGDGSSGAPRSLREELGREGRWGPLSRGGDRNCRGHFRSPPPQEKPERRAGKASGKFQEAAEGSLQKAHHYPAAAPDSAGGGSAA